MGRRARSARIATAQHAADRCDHFRHFVDDRLNESMQQFLPTVHRLAGGISVDDQDRQDSRVAGKLLDKRRLPCLFLRGDCLGRVGWEGRVRRAK